MPDGDFIDMTGFKTENIFSSVISEPSPVFNETGFNWQDTSPAGGNYDTPVTATDTPKFTGGSTIDWGKTIDQGMNAINFGLKTYGSILAADNAVKDAQLNRYIKGAQIDIAKMQSNSAVEVAGINARTQANIAQTKANLAGSAALGARLGQDNSSMMLWLTVLGLVFAAVQIARS